MSKFFGKIGYGMQTEIRPGVYGDGIVERNYYGTVTKRSFRQDSTEYLNDDLTLSNTISIIADPFAYANLHSIKYIEFMGAKWKVTNIDIQRPRLVLTVGGVYNE